MTGLMLSYPVLKSCYPVTEITVESGTTSWDALMASNTAAGSQLNHISRYPTFNPGVHAFQYPLYRFLCKSILFRHHLELSSRLSNTRHN